MTKVIGLISGTSVDGIDAALVEISGTDIDLKVKLLAGETYPYPAALRERILALVLTEVSILLYRCDRHLIGFPQVAELNDAIVPSFPALFAALNYTRQTVLFGKI